MITRPNTSMLTTLSILIVLSFSLLFSSTTFVGEGRGKILAANNEDWPAPHASLEFVPASGDESGYVVFGFDLDKPMGGMNDRGLFCNMSRCPRKQVSNNPDKSTLFGSLVKTILAQCSDLQDVLDLTDRYNLFELHEAQLMVADSKGRSAIIEGDDILHRDGKYQIMTNFYHTEPDLRPYPHQRYEIVEDLISDGVSIDNFRRILSLSHREGEIQTVYSYIGDLKKKELYLYHFHEYESPKIIDLKTELSQGARIMTLAEYFGGQTIAKDAYDVTYRKNDIDTDLQQNRVRTAIEKIWIWFQEDPEDFNAYAEYELNMMGYQYLQAQGISEAIEVFKLNTMMFPDSWNVWDSLGEGYMNDGQTELAIQMYEKSIDLNPENTNGMDMLKRLRDE